MKDSFRSKFNFLDRTPFPVKVFFGVGWFLVLVIPCFLCAYLGWTFVIAPGFEQATFCSTDNAVYRQIENYAEQWIAIFESSADPVIQFTVPGGRTYTAVTNFDREMRDSFYVVLESSRIDAMGAWGFYYLHDQPPLEVKPGYYQYRHLAKGIHCYWRDRNWASRVEN